MAAGNVTGMSLTPAITEAYDNLKMRKSDTCYLKFGVELQAGKSKARNKGKFTDPEIVARSGSNQEQYDAMVATLTDDQGAYVVFDLHFTTDDGRAQEKLILISWCPDTLGIKQKMMIGSNKDSVKKALTGIVASIHASDKAEITYEEAVAAAK